MIPRILTETIYTVDVELESSAPLMAEFHHVSTFDSFSDSHEWVETDMFRYIIIPGERKGNLFFITLYVNLHEDQPVAQVVNLVHDLLEQDICPRYRGMKIHHLGQPYLFLRLKSIQATMAKKKEIGTQRMFTELIDS